MREKNVVNGQKVLLHSHPGPDRLIGLRVHLVETDIFLRKTAQLQKQLSSVGFKTLPPLYFGARSMDQSEYSSSSSSLMAVGGVRARYRHPLVRMATEDE